MLLHLFSPFHKPDQGRITRWVAFGLLAAVFIWGGFECYNVMYVQLGWQEEIPDPSKTPTEFMLSPDDISTTNEGGYVSNNGIHLWRKTPGSEPDRIVRGVDEEITNNGTNVRVIDNWYPGSARLQAQLGLIRVSAGERVELWLETRFGNLLDIPEEFVTEHGWKFQWELQVGENSVPENIDANGFPSLSGTVTPAGPRYIPVAAEGDAQTGPTQTQPFRETDWSPGEIESATGPVLVVRPIPVDPADATRFRREAEPENGEGEGEDGEEGQAEANTTPVTGFIMGKWVIEELTGRYSVRELPLRLVGVGPADYRPSRLEEPKRTYVAPGMTHDPVTGYQLNKSGVPWASVIALVLSLFFLYLSLRFTMGTASGSGKSDRSSSDTEALDESVLSAEEVRKVRKERKREAKARRRAHEVKGGKRPLFSRTAEFLIETDREMKLVVWPTVRRVWYSSAIVIISTIIFAAIMFISDLLLNFVLGDLLGLLG